MASILASVFSKAMKVIACEKDPPPPKKKVEPIDLPKSARVGDSFIGITNMHTPYLNCILSIAKNDQNFVF